MADTRFKPGNKFSKGRPKKPKTQAKDWALAHPYAVATLMQVLYDKGIEGDREAATYVIDRIKGKPKQQTDIDLVGEIGIGSLVKLLGMIQQDRRTKVLEVSNGQEGAGEDTEAETA